jgi:hypothetical protein
VPGKRYDVKVKTLDSKQIWQSPDAQKTIWEVTLEADGKQYPLKTFSPKIAEVGYQGEVESYTNQRGDRFVKQVQKPGGFSRGGGYERDDATIRAQWAIGQAIALTSATMDKKTITMQVIEDYAKQLYATVSRVKGENFGETEAKAAEQHIRSSMGGGQS